MSATILVIEDNRENLDLITYLLGAFGYNVESATDGTSGLERAMNGSYDLVLTDILMPKLDGYALARKFKADPRLVTTPLVAITALAMTGDRDKILSAGFDGYISKPIEPQRFAEEIKSFLASSERGANSRH
jgi:two-component system cell cycle response regulator